MHLLPLGDLSGDRTLAESIPGIHLHVSDPQQETTLVELVESYKVNNIIIVHPSKYWAAPTLLNFSDRTRTGVFQ